MMQRSMRFWVCGMAGAVMALFAMPAPAEADSFVFGISGGHRHKHHGHRHYDHRPHLHHHHRSHVWSGFHHYRHVHRPPTVVVRPPVVFAPPPVVYAAPPVVSAVPSSPVYQARDGRYCREYQGTVTINGVSQPSYGTACLMPDGTWRVVN